MLLCMRTTIDLDDQLLFELKQEALQKGATLRETVNEHLRYSLAVRKKPVSYRFRWKTHRGRILPGVKLHDRKSLFDLMDGL